MKNKVYLSTILIFVFCGALVRSVSAQYDVDPNADRDAWRTDAYMNRQENLKIFDEVWSRIDKDYYDPNFDHAAWKQARDIYRPKAQTAEMNVDLESTIGAMLKSQNLSGVSATAQPVFGELLEDLEGTGKIRHNTETDHYKPFNYTIGLGFTTSVIGGQQVVTGVDNKYIATTEVQVGWVVRSFDKVPVKRDDGSDSYYTYSAQHTYVYHFLDNNKKPVDRRVSAVVSLYEPAPRVEKVIKDGIGYIRIDEFDSGAGKWLGQAVAGLNGQKTLIIDLRQNSGGVIAEAIESLRPFFTHDADFGSQIGRNGKTNSLKIEGSGTGFGGKLIVLVDKETAGAAEMFAAAVQENGRGQIVGPGTRGDSLENRTYYLIKSFKLELPIADYLSPNGHRVQGVGIKPDIDVDQTIEDVRQGRDHILDRAMALAK